MAPHDGQPRPTMSSRPPSLADPRPSEHRSRRALLALLAIALTALALSGCGRGQRASASRPRASVGDPEDAPRSSTPKRLVTVDPVPAAGPDVVYTAATATTLGPAVATIPARVYVPHSVADTVDVI